MWMKTFIFLLILLLLGICCISSLFVVKEGFELPYTHIAPTSCHNHLSCPSSSDSIADILQNMPPHVYAYTPASHANPSVSPTVAPSVHPSVSTIVFPSDYHSVQDSAPLSPVSTSDLIPSMISASETATSTTMNTQPVNNNASSFYPTAAYNYIPSTNASSTPSSNTIQQRIVSLQDQLKKTNKGELELTDDFYTQWQNELFSIRNELDALQESIQCADDIKILPKMRKDAITLKQILDTMANNYFL